MMVILYSPISIWSIEPSQLYCGAANQEGEGWKDGKKADDGGVEWNHSSLHFGDEDDECSDDHTYPTRWNTCMVREKY